MIYNNSKQLYEANKTYTSKGTFSWNVTCSKPLLFTLSVNDTVGINNTPPEVRNINLSFRDPSNITNSTLIANWTFFDLDAADVANVNETYWYNNSIEVLALRNMTRVEDGNTTKGQNWSFTVRIYDGQNWSTIVGSPNLTILNAAPEFNQSAVAFTARSSILFAYVINATDIDNDTLSYNSNITLTTINSTNGTIMFIPTEEQIGVYNINFTIGDGQAPNVTQILTLNILHHTLKSILR